MCGIFGQVGGSLDTDGLDRVGQSLRHRGPDAEGRYIDEAARVFFLHRRLRIIDLSERGAQPMTNQDGSVEVIFNGEIYNHHALRAELEALGHVFRSRSDTEVLVHGWVAWGPSLVARLDGMFAFAIWDRRTSTLCLARDRIGKKPLYLSDHAGVLRFGSNIASMHAAGLPEEVDLTGLPFYLAYGWIPPPHTFHAHVMQLAPGQMLVRRSDGSGAVVGSVLTTYFEPHFGDTDGRPDSWPEATRRVRQLVTDAVERRLESDVPLGAFLSGGIDSTIIVGVMSRLMTSKVRTFSIGFSQDPRFDETDYARLAAKSFGCEHTEFTLEPSSFDLVETLIRHHDGPFGDSSAIPTFVVSALTRQQVTVALTGDGGDELFCGYERFLAAEAAERIPLWMRTTLATASAALPASSSDRSLLGKARRFLGASELPIADRMARWNSFFPRPRQLLRGDVAVALGDAVDQPLAWQRAMFAHGHGHTALSRILEHNFRTYLPNDLLVKADRTSMAHGLELRAPFLDSTLLAYVSQLPPAYLRRGTTTKWILKRAFADLLPTKIRTRGKMGFGVPLAVWFRTNLRGYLQDVLGPTARLYQYLDRTRVRAIIDEHMSERADHGQRLWALLTLELWLRGRSSQVKHAEAA